MARDIFSHEYAVSLETERNLHQIISMVSHLSTNESRRASGFSTRSIGYKDRLLGIEQLRRIPYTLLKKVDACGSSAIMAVIFNDDQTTSCFHSIDPCVRHIPGLDCIRVVHFQISRRSRFSSAMGRNSRFLDGRDKPLQCRSHTAHRTGNFRRSGRPHPGPESRRFYLPYVYGNYPGPLESSPLRSGGSDLAGVDRYLAGTEFSCALEYV